MKNKRIFIIALLFIAISSVLLTFSCSDQRPLNKTDDEIYAEMSQLNSSKLIRKINKLEKKLPQTPEAKTDLLPLYMALTDKADDFSENELIELIKRNDTLFGIESAFVKMYVQNGYDHSKMLSLLDDEDIAAETKEYITAHCNFTIDELCEIFRKYDDKTAVIAIKIICAHNPDTAMKLTEELINSGSKISDEKYVAACLGIAQFCEDNQDSDALDKKSYINILKGIFEKSDSEYVRNQTIYALGRIHDYDSFAWIIENDNIDFYTKVSVIERNVKLMKEQIASASSENDIIAVKEAMTLHPIIDIGDALNNAIEQGIIPASDKLISLIDSIQKNGIIAVDKYY